MNTLIKLTIDDELRSISKALSKIGFRIIITSSPDEASSLGVPPSEIFRLDIVSGDMGRVTGAVHGDSKMVFIYGQQRSYLRDSEDVLAVLLHEAGHCLPYFTSDEVMAWNRGFSWVSVITSRMWSIRHQSLETYGILEGGKA